jgi:LAO/AO transport system kinase
MSASETGWQQAFLKGDTRGLARAITAAENEPAAAHALLAEVSDRLGHAHVIGITGPPGVGKSTLTGKLAEQLLSRGHSLGLLLVDPSSPFTGGAILGDRLRLPDIAGRSSVFVRSMSSRGSMGGLSRATGDAIKLLDAFGKDYILVETVGTGQAETDIVSVADSVVVVAVPGLGDDVQAMKAGILEIADLFVVNKADRDGADRIERELLSMLKMQSTPSAWNIPVLKTVATSGQGISELADALAAHWKYLTQSGKLSEKRSLRTESELLELLRVQLLDELRRQVDPKEQVALTNDIMAGRLTVYQAAERLWNQLFGGFVACSTTSSQEGGETMIKKIAHLGIAVKNLEEAKHFYAEMLGLSTEGEEEVAAQKVKTAFISVGETHLELLESTDPEGPIAKSIAARGEGIHHIAYEVDDIEATLAELKQKGVRLIDQTPREGAHGSKVAFIHPKAGMGVLIELCQFPH